MDSVTITHNLFASVLADWGYRKISGKEGTCTYQNRDWDKKWLLGDKKEEQFVYLSINGKQNSKYFKFNLSATVKKEQLEYFQSHLSAEFHPPNILTEPGKDQYWKTLISGIEPRKYEKGDIVPKSEFAEFCQELKECLLRIQNATALKAQQEALGISTDITIWPKELPLISERPEVYWAIAPGENNRSDYYGDLALEHGFVGIGFRFQAFCHQTQLTEEALSNRKKFWKHMNQGNKILETELQVQNGSYSEIFAFLTRVRAGDTIFLLQGTTLLWKGRFSDELYYPHKTIDSRYLLRLVKWDETIGDVSKQEMIEQIRAFKDKKLTWKKWLEFLQPVSKTLQKSIQIEELPFDANIPDRATFRSLKRPSELQEKKTLFTQAYFTPKDKNKYFTINHDYIEQRSKILDPVSQSILHYLQSLYKQKKGEQKKHKTLRSLISTVLKHKTVILEGVPGVGKTYFFEQLSCYQKEDSELPYFQHHRFLTFHPSTDYSDFIGGLRPQIIDEKLVFVPEKGHMLQILEKAKKGPVLLWIDECNRANLPRVFGDLITLLGNKNPPKLQVSNVGLAEDLDVNQQAENGKRLIENLHIIGTLNTSDRSVTPMDLALRRRFKFFRLEPFDQELALNEFSTIPAIQSHVSCYLELNGLLKEQLGQDYLIGHSYLFEIKNNLEAGAMNVWSYSILPNIIDSLVLAQREDLFQSINSILEKYNIASKLEQKGSGFNKMLLVKQASFNSQSDIISLLLQKNNVVLEGVPGTGKTYTLNNLAENWRKRTGKELRKQSITFHPSSSYEDFVGGLFPAQSKTSKELIFRYQKGILFNIAEVAIADPEQDYLLFIDEINRANIPKVMGELLTVMEQSKRATPATNKMLDDKTNLWSISVGDKKLALPSNLYILATLNTSDRSVISMDSALRRRFAYYRMDTLIHPARKQHLPENIDTDLLSSLLQINQELLKIGPDAVLGHSYLFEYADSEDSTIAEFFQLTILPQIADILNASTPANLESITQKINALTPKESTHKLSLPKQDSIVFVQIKGS